jgi:hypothetical protein
MYHRFTATMEFIDDYGINNIIFNGALSGLSDGELQERQLVIEKTKASDLGESVYYVLAIAKLTADEVGIFKPNAVLPGGNAPS